MVFNVRGWSCLYMYFFPFQIFAALSATAAAVKCYIYVIAELLLNEGEMLQKVLEEMAVCISLVSLELCFLGIRVTMSEMQKDYPWQT